MVVEKPNRPVTPVEEPAVESISSESEYDFTGIDIQMSKIYEQILVKKGHKYYRDE
jgi:hypothetical protein